MSLDELAAAAEKTAHAYDEALEGGAGADELAGLLEAHREAEEARALAAWQAQQRSSHGDDLEFDGYVVTNLAAPPTVFDDEVMGAVGG